MTYLELLEAINNYYSNTTRTAAETAADLLNMADLCERLSLSIDIPENEI